MPEQYLKDIADIMAERPIEGEDMLPDMVGTGWMRRSAPEIEGAEARPASLSGMPTLPIGDASGEAAVWP